MVLLRRMDLVQAWQIAERVRRVIAAAPVPLTGTGVAPVQ